MLINTIIINVHIYTGYDVPFTVILNMHVAGEFDLHIIVCLYLLNKTRGVEDSFGQ